MHVTQELAVPPAVASQYWRIYDEAFAPLRLASPHRQSLYEDEFHEEMVDERIIKFVLWDEDVALGLANVATDVAAVPWVSPAYFAHHFPEHFADHRIYYFGALLIAEPHQRRHLANALFAELTNFVISNDGIAAFDCAGINENVVPVHCKRAMERQALEFGIEKLDSEHYYVCTPRGFKPGFGPGQPFGLETASR